MFKFLLINWPFIAVLVVLVIFILVISALIEGWIDGKNKVQNGPREEMFWCHKHGAFRKKHCLPLFPELMGKPVNSFVCPTCYKEMVFDAPNTKLKG